MTRKYALTGISMLFVLTALTACGGGGGGGAPAPAPATPTAISITPANQSLRIGTTRQLTATGNYSDGSTQNLTASVVWTSSAGITVSNTGLVTAAAIGSSTITATSGATTGTTTVIVSAVSLPKTGQTTCYDTAGVVLASCLGTGQDGELQTGVAEPSPRFVVGTVVGTTDQCVTDSLTGLMWVRSPSTTQDTWANALAGANSLTLCGFSDWRLPNRKELRSLVNYSTTNNDATLNTPVGPFSNVSSSLYWSSSSYAGGVFAWQVFMSSGAEIANSKSLIRYVWPVRAGQ